MCFSLAFFFQLAIWAVIVVAIYLIIKLILPAILSKLGEPGTLLSNAINIIMWAVMIIIVIYIIWMLVDCLLGSGGVRLPTVPRR